MPVTKGYDGLASIGATPVSVAYIRTWSHSSERDETEVGPWVGNANKETTVGGKIGTLELEGDVPIGGNAGIQDILDAYENATNDPFTINTEDGFQVVYSAPSYLSFNIEADAGAQQTWSATLKGAYAVTQDT
jgi:hypothetical protein